MDAQLSFVDITPEVAQEFLGKNIEDNRHPIADRIERMARDMANGDWIPTADPIKFNSAGYLIDGQHRLRAVLKSGATIRFLVARNLAEDSVYVIDTGASRSAAQALKIMASDLPNRTVLVSAAQALNAYDKGFVKDTGSIVPSHIRLTNAEVIKKIEDDRESYIRAAKVAQTLSGTLILPSSIKATAYLIFERIDPEACAEFFNALVNGSSQVPVNDPIAALIRRAFQDRISNRKPTLGLGLFYMIRAWNAWRDEQGIKNFSTTTWTGNTAVPKPR